MVLSLGKVGLAFAIVGFVAATFGAALETALSTGYTLSQYLGWSWGKLLSPHKIPRRFIFLDRLPVDARGKMDRRALEALATTEPA